jgi:FkbM family methyltransferase
MSAPLMDTNISIPKDYLDFLRTSIPSFWEMKTALMRVKTLKALDEFYSYLLTEGYASHSQLFQDTFVDFLFMKKESGRFLEFGATNGIELSNSFMLETNRSWRGVLAEPDPQWHDALKKNRPNAKIITDCIYNQSGQKMRFISSAVGVLSSLKVHAEDDSDGPLSGNSKSRMAKFNEVEVSTISLNDVFEDYFNGEPIEYMSVDTEGSEYEILSAFNFNKYRPSVVTVEHNYTDAQTKLDKLFNNNGYIRIFSELTNFDAWYVLMDFAHERKLV